MESDNEEFEDASETFGMDDYFVDNNGGGGGGGMATTSQRIEPLISEAIEDDIVGSIQFSEQYTQRYGTKHPTFYVGTLDDALKEACHKPTKDRKILALYLHHDQSVLANVFCTQLLGNEHVTQLLDHNFVLWGWDLTYAANKSRLYRAVAACDCLGSNSNNKITANLWNVPTTKLPAIIVIMKNRSNIIVYTIIYGNVGVNDFLSRLIEVVDVFNDNRRAELQEERERAERELVKWEQDVAYNQSLEADRAKEALRRQQAEAERTELERIESERAVARRRKETYRREVEATLPPEPAETHDAPRRIGARGSSTTTTNNHHGGGGATTSAMSHSNNNNNGRLSNNDNNTVGGANNTTSTTTTSTSTTKIRFRLPKGDHLERRFHANAPLQTLLDYLVVEGYPSDEYKAISSWPRRDLTVLDVTKTLEELKLCPQETVILEQR